MEVHVFKKPEIKEHNYPIKVSLKAIGYNKRFEDVIRRAFDGDEELHKYHAKPASYVGCMVRHTFNEIGKSKKKVGAFLQCYMVVYKDPNRDTHVIGFTCICKFPIPILYSFGINHAFRKPEILKAWLKTVEAKLGKQYAVTLNQKNTRAIMFFERNGFMQAAENRRQKIVSLTQARG